MSKLKLIKFESIRDICLKIWWLSCPSSGSSIARGLVNDRPTDNGTLGWTLIFVELFTTANSSRNKSPKCQTRGAYCLCSFRAFSRGKKSIVSQLKTVQASTFSFNENRQDKITFCSTATSALNEHDLLCYCCAIRPQFNIFPMERRAGGGTRSPTGTKSQISCSPRY